MCNAYEIHTDLVTKHYYYIGKLKRTDFFDWEVTRNDVTANDIGVS